MEELLNSSKMKRISSKVLSNSSKRAATKDAGADAASKNHHNRTESKGRKSGKMKCTDHDCKSESGSAKNYLKVSKGVGLTSLASKMKELEISSARKSAY
uniref:Uncharacterized protein n=1 Tax=Leptocylindrus danicus TaxID=163516 RepID=A0A7S2JZS4_9STRA